MADAPLLDTLARFAEQRLASATEPWSTRVRDVVLAQGGRVSLARVAKSMALSPRTLQSRLDGEGTSCKQILDDVRKELALGYLERDDLSLSEIAFLLGYSEQSAFNHAFKRWTGHSPGEHKRAG
jgi:AraC-like DNA-binding protein